MVATVVLEPEAATTDTARRPTWGHRPALDGLRAVAVGLVIAFHVDLPVAAGGFVGVDLFFVLSGFVVTNVIWVELSTSNSLRLRRFYARRMRRLTPAALALVVGTALMYVLVAPLVERLSLVSDAQAALLYVANWHALAESTDYFESTTAPSPFLHFWSLAIEEQFYLLFPVLMVLLWKASRRLGTQRLIPWAIGILIATSLSLQLYWATRGANEAYYRTDARLYQLLAGALLAILIVRSRRRRLSMWFASMGLAGLAGLVILSSSAISATPSIRGIAATVCSLAIVGGLELGPRSVLNHGLERPTIVYLGTISYGIYLWHWPVILVTQRLFVIQPLTMLALAGTISVGLAAASHRIIESPVRRNPLLDPRPLAVITTGLAVTLATALVVVPLVLESRRTPRLANDPAPTVLQTQDASERPAGFDDPVPSNIDYEEILSFRAAFPECAATDVSTCTVREGRGLHVLVVGDSIAQSYIPAFETIAEDLDWTLSLNIAQGCSWQTGLLPRPDVSAESQDRCTQQRDPWYDTALDELEPDVIVLAQLSRDDERFASLVIPADEENAGSSLSEVNATTIRSTVEMLQGTGASIVVIEPIPIAPGLRSPTDCLSSATTVGECAFARPPAAASEVPIRLAAHDLDGVVTVDLDDLICETDDLCLPINAGGAVVWRDDGHPSHLFVNAVTDDIRDLLIASGGLETRER